VAEFPPAIPRAIERIFSADDKGDLDQFLYLVEIREGWIPTVSLRYNFEATIPELRIRVGLFRQISGVTAAVGMRFETPEGPGSHNYYHAQLVAGLDRTHDFLFEGRNVPSHFPAFPLDASSPQQLFAAFIAALYGSPKERHPYLRRSLAGLRETSLGNCHFSAIPERFIFRAKDRAGNVHVVETEMNRSDFERAWLKEEGKRAKCLGPGHRADVTRRL
jgi:hypothetical protein